MLHDPGSYSEPTDYSSIRLSNDEKEVLKSLGAQYAAIGALPENSERAELWRALNDLESHRPLVWINEIPWHEMNVDDELTLKTEHPWARDLETQLRRTIYQWNHLRGDMVVKPYLECPLVIHSSDFGIHEEVVVAKTDEKNDIVSRHFHIQLKSMDDIEKIRMPKVTHNEAMTEMTYSLMGDLFKDIVAVRKVGQTHIWYTPWDYLIRWTGVQEAMIALFDDPDFINAAVDRLSAAWMVELDQFEEQNLLSLDCDNTRIGSGGYGYTKALPGEPYQKGRVKPHNMWGCSNAQIFAEVSPEMHWEFALRHDLDWLSRFGLTYYGCCEPLQNKIDLLRRIPNLRKVSVSPWNDYDKILPAIGGDYVASVKPNPAVFAGESWSPELARENILKALRAGGDFSHIELIMKDISTVSYQPRRLWEWAELATETAKSFAP